MDAGYWTTNKAFILRGSICRWIQKELNARFKNPETFIGFVNTAGHRYEAPVPEGEEIELDLEDSDTKKAVKIRTWDTVIAVIIYKKGPPEELVKLA